MKTEHIVIVTTPASKITPMEGDNHWDGSGTTLIYALGSFTPRFFRRRRLRWAAPYARDWCLARTIRRWFERSEP